jgi:hypothetical protein
MGSLYGNALKFFSGSHESPSLVAIAEEATASVPEPTGRGEYEATITTSGEAVTTKFTVMHWAGAGAPTLVFHHGSGDIPYHRRLAKILGSDASSRAPFEAANIIATCSPYNGSRREYFAAIRDLRMFAVLVAGSVALIEAIVRFAGPSSRTLVSGISLGGWIANLHHAVHDSASEYRPIFAGAALDALFLDSAYTRMTAKDALRAPAALTDCLNFEEEFRARQNGSVVAMLARHDQYIVLDRQASIYAPENLHVIEKGHITGSADNRTLREFLAQGIG